MQTKGIRLWSKNYTLVYVPFIDRFFCQSRCSFFLFRQLCLYITDSLHLFTLFLTDFFKSVRRKASRMNILFSAIFKFCTTNQFFLQTSQPPATSADLSGLILFLYEIVP